jgi:uncharacterized phage protein (predicted DNA packaging)
VIIIKISEVTIQNIKDYLRLEDDTEDTLISTILVAIKAYIKSYTGLTIEFMDTKEDLTIVLMILANEMYENRQYTVEKDKVNKVVQSILDMHCVNLL